MDDSDYRLSDRPFNGLIDHAIYNKTIMNHYFPPKTTHYVTIIREPLKHFKSTFNYFKVEPIVGIFAKQPLTEYLDYVEHFIVFIKTKLHLSLWHVLFDKLADCTVMSVITGLFTPVFISAFSM
jgi:hypothetical protein